MKMTINLRKKIELNLKLITIHQIRSFFSDSLGSIDSA